MRTSRRAFLGACAAGAARGAAAPGAAVRLGFDGTLANAGEWGGAARLQGPATDPRVLLAFGESGVADLTTDWVHVRGGRLLLEDARLAAVDSFTASVAFNPLRLDRNMTVLGRAGRWLIRVQADGWVSLATYYSATASQISFISKVAAIDSWHEIAIAFDRARLRLDFVLRPAGEGGRATAGSFQLVAATFQGAAATPLDIGGVGGAEPFYGYLDNVVLYDRALPREEFTALLDSAAPSLLYIGPLPFETSIMPMERNPAVALPARSDVPMSSRWWHPDGAADPHDTLRDLARFGATRIEWIYTTDAQRIRQARDAGFSICPCINATDSARGRPYSARDFDGAFMTFPWMISWKEADGLPPGAACVNNAAFRDYLAQTALRLVQAGAAGVQYDDWGSNLSLRSVSECLCDFCLERFRTWLGETYAAGDLDKWGASAAGFNYKEHLKAQKRVTSAREYAAYRAQSAADPLQQAYVQFQYGSVRENLAALQKALAAGASGGRRPTLSVNAGFPGTSQSNMPAADAPDYFVGEASEESVTGLFINAKLAECLHRVAILSPFPYHVSHARSEIALQYALGQLCLAPYDIWMRTSDLPRHFGNPADYADLFEFVRRNAELLDGCETVATVGVAVDTSKAQDARFRTVVETFARAGVPFVVLPLGKQYFEPYLSPAWAERPRHVVNLTALTDLERRFPNARIWTGSLTVELLRAVAVVSVEPEEVVATVRAKGGEGKYAAIHLVNRNFDESGGALTLEQVGVRLLQAGFWGRPVSVELLAPGAQSRALEVRPFGRDLRVVVPELRTWAVLKVGY